MADIDNIMADLRFKTHLQDQIKQLKKEIRFLLRNCKITESGHLDTWMSKVKYFDKLKEKYGVE